ncbi:MAG: hypothetical protein WC703_08100, partial [Candidatus Neomarinimicrobiota bacterium]
MISKEPENFIVPAMKKCSRCGIEKPLTEFYRNNASKDKTTSSCKICLKASLKVYNQSEKGKARQKAQYRAF